MTLADSSVIDRSESACYIGQLMSDQMPKNLTIVICLGNFSHLAISGVSILHGASLSVGEFASLKIGTGTYISWRTKIYAENNITIGKNCAISFDVTILNNDVHGFGNPPYSAPIVIEDNVWVGCNATILKGVTIEKGSVVTKSCLPLSLIGGVPAKIIREGIEWMDAPRIKAGKSYEY